MRVRFAPSPTGIPHVGLARTALFNWVFARHHEGTVVFRIEDTDVARDTEESYALLLDVLRWLGLDWDEGPEVGGPHAPYRQSKRLHVYADVARRLLEAGRAYSCYCSPEELDERREQARAEGRTPGYDGHCRELTGAQVSAHRKEGREPVLRLRMPDHTITFDDLVRGEISFHPEHVPDFVLVRGNGHPLYTLVNPVDDALMGITHVLRGEDLLSSTPRQIALYDALGEVGVGTGTPPRFGHLPYVMGEGNRKLSKRDPESNLLAYRDRGFLPEGLLNYLALLGWAIADDRDVFTVAEMVDAFRVDRVNPNPARFDLKKCEAINAAHVRALATDDLAERMVPFLQSAQVLGPEATDAQMSVLRAAAPLVQERMVTLQEAVPMLGFLFVPDERFRVDADDAAKVLTGEGRQVAAAAYDALSPLTDWSTPAIEQALRAALVDRLGLKPRHAFGPVRVAVTGRRVSPPLFESLELLGRERSLARLQQAQAG
ncbi:MAG: glutamate--tRNA ligase [Actinomycetota bacterium]|nr:glutamate--tRNA ligase [Actinomycetota bacterium]